MSVQTKKCSACGKNAVRVMTGCVRSVDPDVEERVLEREWIWWCGCGEVGEGEWIVGNHVEDTRRSKWEYANEVEADDSDLKSLSDCLEMRDYDDALIALIEKSSLNDVLTTIPSRNEVDQKTLIVKHEGRKYRIAFHMTEPIHPGRPRLHVIRDPVRHRWVLWLC